VAPACVLADLDLVRPLGQAGIRCGVVALGRDPVRWSRFTSAFVDRSTWTTPDEQVAGLRGFAARQDERPTLFYANDQDLLLVSRHRAALAVCFRIMIAEPELVEVLLDKTRAHQRFEALGFPVPRTWLLRPGQEPPPGDIEYPVVLKPVIRERAPAIGGAAKAAAIASAAALQEAWPDMATDGGEVVAQQLIVGGEHRIESYHAYVDRAGEIAAEFCGRKVRTYPLRYGNTTALVVTDAKDVRDLGRRIVRGLALRGVAKVDLKRDPDGRLWLLEVNPRFNLWHHAGAAAGVNIPAMVHADLTGGTGPARRPARVGTTWTDPLMDRRARRAAGLSLRRWVRWVLACDVRWSIAWDDPMPFVRGIAFPYVKRRLPAAR
jgi:D-aspartate ligase